MFVTAFLLGLFGSAGHCVGMCSGVTLVLARTGVAPGWRLLIAHLGRVITYAFLGALVGSVGLILGQVVHSTDHANQAGHGMAAVSVTSFDMLQGGLALLGGMVAVYMALALSGRLPAPERYLMRFTRGWSQQMRQLGNGRFGLLTPLVAGLLWGLLPCGLVLTALLTAAVAATPVHGALLMFTFGVGTWPMLLALTLLARSRKSAPTPWLRSVAALLVGIFGVQLALRGLAAWGWLAHMHIGQLVLW